MKHEFHWSVFNADPKFMEFFCSCGGWKWKTERPHSMAEGRTTVDRATQRHDDHVDNPNVEDAVIVSETPHEWKFESTNRIIPIISAQSTYERYDPFGDGHTFKKPSSGYTFTTASSNEGNGLTRDRVGEFKRRMGKGWKNI